MTCLCVDETPWYTSLQEEFTFIMFTPRSEIAGAKTWPWNGSSEGCRCHRSAHTDIVAVQHVTTGLQFPNSGYKEEGGGAAEWCQSLNQLQLNQLQGSWKYLHSYQPKGWITPLQRQFITFHTNGHAKRFQANAIDSVKCPQLALIGGFPVLFGSCLHTVIKLFASLVTDKCISRTRERELS